MQDSRSELVEQNLGLVKAIVRGLRYRIPRSIELEDLVGIGTIGLIEAAQRYRPEEGTPFCAYARIRIKGAIKDELRRHDTATRSQRHEHRRRARRDSCAVTAFSTGQSPTAMVPQLAAGSVLIPQLTNQASFDDVAGEASDGSDDRLALEQVMQRYGHRLDDRERQVLHWHYFEDYSFSEIGARMSVSAARICQIHGKALAKLR